MGQRAFLTDGAFRVRDPPSAAARPDVRLFGRESIEATVDRGRRTQAHEIGAPPRKNRSMDRSKRGRAGGRRALANGSPKPNSRFAQTPKSCSWGRWPALHLDQRGDRQASWHREEAMKITPRVHQFETTDRLWMGTDRLGTKTTPDRKPQQAHTGPCMRHQLQLPRVPPIRRTHHPTTRVRPTAHNPPANPARGAFLGTRLKK